MAPCISINLLIALPLWVKKQTNKKRGHIRECFSNHYSLLKRCNLSLLCPVLSQNIVTWNLGCWGCDSLRFSCIGIVLIHFFLMRTFVMVFYSEYKILLLLCTIIPPILARQSAVSYLFSPQWAGIHWSARSNCLPCSAEYSLTRSILCRDVLGPNPSWQSQKNLKD